MDYPFPTFTRQSVTLPGETLPEIVERNYARQSGRQFTTFVIDDKSWQVIMRDYPAPERSTTTSVFQLDATAMAARSAERVRMNRARRLEVDAQQSQGLDDLV